MFSVGAVAQNADTDTKPQADPSQQLQKLVQFYRYLVGFYIDEVDSEIVMVTIVPSDMEYPASNEKGKAHYRFANNSTVVVSLGQQMLTSRVLPIYEFGQTVIL
jgi:hypothetical protein